MRQVDSGHIIVFVLSLLFLSALLTLPEYFEDEVQRLNVAEMIDRYCPNWYIRA